MSAREKSKTVEAKKWLQGCTAKEMTNATWNGASGTRAWTNAPSQGGGDETAPLTVMPILRRYRRRVVIATLIVDGVGRVAARYGSVDSLFRTSETEVAQCSRPLSSHVSRSSQDLQVGPGSSCFLSGKPPFARKGDTARAQLRRRCCSPNCRWAIRYVSAVGALRVDPVSSVHVVFLLYSCFRDIRPVSYFLP